MKNFFAKDGKIEWPGKEEHSELKIGKTVQEVIKDMTPEQLEAFKKERYEKFIKPLMKRNIQELESKLSQKKDK